MRKWIRIWSAVFCLLGVFLLPVGGWAWGQKPDIEVFVVGDSLSDPGNLFELTQFFPPPPNEQRNCDGPVWPEYFEEVTGVPVDSRAYGGALSGVFQVDFGLYELSFSNFNNVQYPQLFDPVTYPLPGVEEEVDGLLEDFPDGLNPHALYVVWAGSNDFFLGLTLQDQMQDPNALRATLQATAQNIEDTVCRLASAGARHFAVGNMPDIGLTPYARSLGDGTAESFSVVIAGFNALLEERLDHLVRHSNFPASRFESPWKARWRCQGPKSGAGSSRSERAELESSYQKRCAARVRSLVILDTYGYLQEAVANPAAFGLADSTTPCVLLGPGADCSEYLFWDPVHLTTAGQEVFTARILDAFCGTAKRDSGSRGWPERMPPLPWWGVCYGAR